MTLEPSTDASPIRGIVFIIFAMLTFATMDGVSKFLVTDYSIAQLFLVRYFVYIFFALWVCRKIGPRRALAAKRPVLQIVRGVVLLVEGFAFVLSFRYLSLADTHAIAAAAPLIVTILAATLLAERVGIHRWLAVAAGFAGALIVIRPGFGTMSWPVLIPVAAAGTYAVMQIQTRILSAYDRSEVTIFYTAIVGLAIMLVTGPFFWIWPPQETLARDLALMVAIGLLGAVAHWLLILAYRHAQASVLQPYTYFLVAWAIAVGYIAFGDFPDLWTITGAAVVVLSGLYTFQRERRTLST